MNLATNTEESIDIIRPTTGTVSTAIENQMLWCMGTIMILPPTIGTLTVTHIDHVTMMSENTEESLMDVFLKIMIEEPIVKLKIEEITLDKTTDIITIVINTETIIKETTTEEKTIEERATETMDREETVEA